MIQIFVFAGQESYAAEDSDKLGGKDKEVQEVVGTDKSKQDKDLKSRVIVKYKDSTSLELIDKVEKTVSNIVKFNKVKNKKQLNKNKIEVYELNSTDDLENAIREFMKSDSVDYVQEDYILSLFDYPSDPEFSKQWYLLNNGQEVNGQVGVQGNDINVSNVWNLTKGSPDVVVGVIDTGVDVNHEDLRSNIFINTGEIPDNGIDDDLNGYIDDYQGIDFANDDNTVFDSSLEDKHGTHVAGVISAAENQIGICGAAPNVKILPVKFISGNRGYTSDVIESIEYCSMMEVDVVNCSWGSTEENYALWQAMKESGLTFICAAGNNGWDTSNQKIYPAGFDLPNIIAVAAIDNSGNIASFSNYGEGVDVAAPGVNLLSTLPGNSYGMLSGTSMSAPLVTATAALLKSYDHDITQTELISRIINCVDKTAELRGLVSGGRLNAEAVINNTVANYEPVPTPTNNDLYTAIPTYPQGEKNIDELLTDPKDNSYEANNKDIKPAYTSVNSEKEVKEVVKIPEDNGLDTTRSNIDAQDISTLSYIYEVEPNDTSSTGMTVNIGTIYGTAVSQNDSDWYIVNLEANKEYTISLKGIQEGNDFGLFLYGPDLSYIDLSDYIGTADEIITFTPQDSADYYINTYCFSYLSSGENSYQLLIYPNDSLPDAFEANDSKDTAKSITQGVPINATININTDEDWYFVNATTSGKLTVTLNNIPENCDYDIVVYDENNNYVGSSALTGNSPEKASALINAAGNYYIRVYSWTGSSPTANYELNATISLPDSYEVNDYYYESKEVQLGDNILATIDNSKDEDWFKVNISEAGNYIFALQNVPIGMDYDIYMYDLSRNYINSSIYIGNASEFINQTLNPGSYYIKIVSHSGYSETKEYTFSFNKEKTVSMELDKTSANVGDIITATIKANNISYIAGIQVNVKFDPSVLQAVDPNTGEPYTYNTLPAEGNILVDPNYSNVYMASHCLDEGLLNFAKAYKYLEDYRAGGNSESTGTIATIGFKVLANYATNISMQDIVYENVGIDDSVVEDVVVVDWNGEKISDTEYLVIQPKTINPFSPVIINSNSVMESDLSTASISEPITTMTGGSTTIEGYVGIDFDSKDPLALAGFKVQILGNTTHTLTDDKGYFKITDAPDNTPYILQIYKNEYLTRQIEVAVGAYQIGTAYSPIKMWAGDVFKDNAINMEEIMLIITHFNTSPRDYYIQDPVTIFGPVYVAELTIYADDTAASSFSDGHAFITVKNISSSKKQVGFLTIEPNKMTSIGTWGNEDECHGLWYNLEIHYHEKYDDFKTAVYLRIKITTSQLDTISTYIKDNAKWSTTYNCASFASGLWNSVSATKLDAGSPLNTPINLKKSIANQIDKGSIFNVSPWDDKIYYVEGTTLKESAIHKKFSPNTN